MTKRTTKKPLPDEAAPMAIDKSERLARDEVPPVAHPASPAAIIICPVCGTWRMDNRCDVCGHQEHDT